MIVIENISLQDLQTNFPCLFSAQQVYRDFYRLTEIDLLEKLNSSLLAYADAIATLLMERNSAVATNFLEADNKNIMALLCLPELLREKLYFHEPNMPEEIKLTSPRIIFETDVQTATSLGRIAAEGVTICEVEGLQDAVAAWLASFFVFNFVYPKGAGATLSFIQKVFLGIPPKVKISPKVNRLQKDMHDKMLYLNAKKSQHLEQTNGQSVGPSTICIAGPDVNTIWIAEPNTA